MRAPHELPVNGGVLRYLGQGLDPAVVPVVRPGPDVDTWRLGAHPGVVARLWTDLNGALPADARFLVAGGAALVHPRVGVVLAAALGTSYALRLSGDGEREALSSGFATTHAFTTVGRVLDLAEAFGPGWVFGRFDDREPAWLVEAYRSANL
jgi:hypothetical protein